MKPSTVQRRKFNDDEKRKIILEIFKPGAKVVSIAKKHGINVSCLYRWRRLEMNKQASSQVSVDFATVLVEDNNGPFYDLEEDPPINSPKDTMIEVYFKGCEIHIPSELSIDYITAITKALR